jgi:hypothetical protein
LGALAEPGAVRVCGGGGDMSEIEELENQIAECKALIAEMKTILIELLEREEDAILWGVGSRDQANEIEAILAKVED